MRQSFTLILPVVMLLAACSKSSDSNGGTVGPVNTTPTVTTFAGTGTAGSTDGTKQQASFNDPTQIAMDGAGFFYVTDKQNNAIRRISPQGEVLTLAGNGKSGFSNQSGSVTFNFPSGIAANYGGNLIFIADQGNNAIRLIANQNTASTFAGDGKSGLVNSSDTASRFNGPAAVALDSAGNIYVADAGNNVIRKITAKGSASTLAGSGIRGSANGTGATASFNGPTALCIDGAGNIYVADQGNNMIRKISPLGVVTTIAGDGTAGLKDGKLTASEFNQPGGVAIDKDGYLYVSDTNNNVIRKIYPTGEVTTYAGSGQQGSANGSLANSSFNSPQGLVVDQYGRIFVVDTGNDEIRLITP